MNQQAPFTAADLAELEMLLLDRASAVIAMEDVHDGNHDPNAIAVRHDVDGTGYETREALDTAVKIAEWEAARGYRATFFLLHTAPYWNAPGFGDKLCRIAEFGHEIGIHANALAEALRTGEDPDLILEQAIGTLRGFGFPVRGVAGHGDSICVRDKETDEDSFANDEQFVECARPQQGAPDRLITRGRIALKLAPRPLADFGLEYEALKLAYSGKMKPFRVSDSGGRWFNPGWAETVERWTAERKAYPHETVAGPVVRQLHFLWHPDWWANAFVPARATA